MSSDGEARAFFACSGKRVPSPVMAERALEPMVARGSNPDSPVTSHGLTQEPQERTERVSLATSPHGISFVTFWAILLGIGKIVAQSSHCGGMPRVTGFSFSTKCRYGRLWPVHEPGYSQQNIVGVFGMPSSGWTTERV